MKTSNVTKLIFMGLNIIFWAYCAWLVGGVFTFVFVFSICSFAARLLPVIYEGDDES